MCVCIYIYVCIYVYVYVHMYICILNTFVFESGAYQKRFESPGVSNMLRELCRNHPALTSFQTGFMVPSHDQ